MAAKIHVERMMHRNSIMVSGDSAASYALVKLIPSTEGGNKPLGLNLALVLDVSGSMHEYDGTDQKRIERVRQAAAAAIDKLKPNDRIAIIAFAQDAKILLPSTTLADRAPIDRVISDIENADVDPGGTAMDLGLQLALAEVDKNTAAGLLSQIVLLTDGETSGEQLCRQLAQQAAQKKIHLTVMGVGTEWNATLLKDLAKLSDGKWYYIDVNQAQETQRVFLEEFGHLASAAFTNVEIHLRPVKDVRLKRIRQVVPEIKELKLTQPQDRHFAASLATLELDKTSRYVLDLSLPKRPDGKYVIAQFEVTYDVGTGRRETTGMLPLEMLYTAAGHGYINAEVAKHIDEVQIFELNNNLQQAIAADDKPEVQRLAENIARKGDVMGPRAAKKTMLARQVLDELNAGGRVSKKTQLAVDDAARLAEEMPI
jgi:Ca-activated chloride channel family protein